MTTLGCCSVEMLPDRLNDQQRSARTVVGVASLGVAEYDGRVALRCH